MDASLVLLWSLAVLLSRGVALGDRYVPRRHWSSLGSALPRETSRGPSDGEKAAQGLEKLTASLLHDIHLRAGEDFNIALSPIGLWTTLALLWEGAAGKSESELKEKLELSHRTREEAQRIVRRHLGKIRSLYGAKNSATEFTALNFLISDRANRINAEYKHVIREFYHGRPFEVDARDARDADRSSRMINAWVNEATRGHVPSVASPGLLRNLVLVVGNAVYFKSKWKHPFDPSRTVLRPFRDDRGRTISGVPMMNQVEVLPYAYSPRLECQVVRLPYADGTTAMAVILPREGVSLASVLSKMRQTSFDQIIGRNVTEEVVRLSLPRFHVVSRMYLNGVLSQDLETVFSPQLAEFPRIGKNVFVSKLSHKAEVETTEEGTAASAVSAVQFAFKSSPVAFEANRPFVYLIYETRTGSILFAGTYTNPSFG